MKKFALYLFCLFVIGPQMLLSCTQSGSVNTPLSPPAPVTNPAADEVKVPKASPTPVVETVKQQEEGESVDEALDNGHSVPLLVMAFSNPGNSDLSVIRQKIYEADINSAVDQEVGRDREVTDFPFTVDSYLITINSRDGYQKLVDCTYRFPKVKILIIPFSTVRLRSYLTLDYTKPLFKDEPVKNFWIGNSPPLEIPRDFTDKRLNLEDPAVTVDTLQDCRDVSPQCFGTLLKHGYFVHETVVDGQVARPLELISAELKTSIALAAKGVQGDATFPRSLLNHTYGDSVITDIKLSHEIWVSGSPLFDANPEPLVKIAGIDGHPIVVRNPETKAYLFLLPIEVAPSNIPPRYRDTQSSLSAYLSEIENTLETNLGVASL